jgi:hypothetical protein
VATSHPANKINSNSSELILNATVQITILPPRSEADLSTDASQEHVIETVAERGLGTLVALPSEIVILTHNHWKFLAQPRKVQFSNALGELLLEIDGQAFLDLIRYRDAGTIVLSAPVELRPDYVSVLAARAKINLSLLPTATAFGDASALRVGDQVHIPHQSKGDPTRISILTAVVEGLISENGLPAVQLRSLDGEVIIQGDSGGGIWLNGSPVGNMWKSQYVSDWRAWTFGLLEPKIQNTDTSYAAVLPVEYQSLINRIPSETVELSGDLSTGVVE